MAMAVLCERFLSIASAVNAACRSPTRAAASGISSLANPSKAHSRSASVATSDSGCSCHRDAVWLTMLEGITSV